MKQNPHRHMLWKCKVYHVALNFVTTVGPPGLLYYEYSYQQGESLQTFNVLRSRITVTIWASFDLTHYRFAP